MECGKRTAKLRDAVSVCFMESGREVKQYKNIEIPDKIKKLPFENFKCRGNGRGCKIPERALWVAHDEQGFTVEE